MDGLFLGGILLLSLIITAAIGAVEKARERMLLDRPCAGIRWHRLFPNVTHDEIREFLRM